MSSSSVTSVSASPNYWFTDLQNLSQRNSAIGCNCDSTKESSFVPSQPNSVVVFEYQQSYEGTNAEKTTSDQIRGLDDIAKLMIPYLTISITPVRGDGDREPPSKTNSFKMSFSGKTRDRLIKDQVFHQIGIRESLENQYPRLSLSLQVESDRTYNITTEAGAGFFTTESATFRQFSFTAQPNQVRQINLFHALKNPFEDDITYADGKKLSNLTVRTTQFMIECLHGKLSMIKEGKERRLTPTSVIECGLETLTIEE